MSPRTVRDETDDAVAPGDLSRLTGGLAGQGSWLLPEQMDRRRMLDMDRRLGPPRMATYGVIALALVAMAPWTGWWTLAPLALAGLSFRLATGFINRSQRAEYWIFAAWVGTQIMIAGSALIAWNETTQGAAWLAIPIVTLSARFSLRGVILGVGITIALLALITLGLHFDDVIDEPPIVLIPLTAVLAVGILSTALMGSDRDHRDEALIDPLTGMLNRAGLQRRASELEAQSLIGGGSVGVVVVDIDRFKRVNDTWGHSVGDEVLQGVAAAIREDLRAYELAYRLGGEEFLLLLPGANSEEAERIAESVRSRVEEREHSGGITVTVSCGVSTPAPNQPFRFNSLLDAADRALYRAKQSGRNRTQVA